MSKPLSASKGGAGIRVTAQIAPGDVIHANVEDSGGNDSLSTLVIVNPNPNTITLYLGVSGPDIDPVQWERHDVSSTDEGQEPATIRIPKILGPGFTLSAYVEKSPGYQPCLVYGAVEAGAIDGGSGAPVTSLPGMWLGGVADSFTLNQTESKLQNYTRAGEWDWPDKDDIDPVGGEITIPKTGIYSVNFLVIGEQGNNTKEEYIEARLKIQMVPSGEEVYVLDVIDVATDKTFLRALGNSVTRVFYENEKISLWLYASANLGTFTIQGCTFEAIGNAEEGSVYP